MKVTYYTFHILICACIFPIIFRSRKTVSTPYRASEKIESGLTEVKIYFRDKIKFCFARSLNFN